MKFLGLIQSRIALWVIMALFLLLEVGTKLTVHALGDVAQIVCNAGIGLGIGIAWFAQIRMSLVIFGVLIWIYCTECADWRWRNLIFGALFAGAISNFGERLLFGCVTDFIPFFGWWVMNLADALIVGAITIITIYILRKS